MSCDSYFNCTNNDLSWEDILKRLVVSCDGELALLVNECTTSTGDTCAKNGSFTNGDLTAGRIALNHACSSTDIVAVTVIDPSGVGTTMDFTLGDLAGANTGAYITLDFGGAIAGGTWTWALIAVV